MYREKQYERATNLYMSNCLDNLSVYKLKEVQALFMLAEAWLRVKPLTINNCWVHTKILLNTAEVVSEPPTTSLPLEDDVVDRINELLPQLPDQNEDEVEEEEEFVDVEENRRRLKEALETVLALDFPVNELEQKVHRCLGQKLQAIRAEEAKSMNQSDLRSFFF
ncbi:hypothetical protein EDC96DRAFT_550347 [Choanephora cucurbitarum]|nr:hypothetical protein EDC96DRAFT_550347 [Choanephora cucurbitarum]